MFHGKNVPDGGAGFARMQKDEYYSHSVTLERAEEQKKNRNEKLTFDNKGTYCRLYVCKCSRKGMSDG